MGVDGASKDRWAQLFLNMCMFADNDAHSEVTDVDASHDAPQIVASFSVRNSGRVPAYISVQIAGGNIFSRLQFLSILEKGIWFSDQYSIFSPQNCHLRIVESM